MQDVIGQVVIVRDSTGYNTEGTLLRLEIDQDGLSYYVLSPSRQVNYVDATQDPPTADCWEIPGLNRIAKHLVVGIHPTHLAPRVPAEKPRRHAKAKP